MSVFGDDACSSRLSYRDGVLSLDRPPVAVHDVQPRGDVGAGRSAGLGGDAGGKPKGVTKGLWRVSRELRGSTAKGSRRRRQGGFGKKGGDSAPRKSKERKPEGNRSGITQLLQSRMVVVGGYRTISGQLWAAQTSRDSTSLQEQRQLRPEVRILARVAQNEQDWSGCQCCRRGKRRRRRRRTRVRIPASRTASFLLSCCSINHTDCNEPLSSPFAVAT